MSGQFAEGIRNYLPGKTIVRAAEPADWMLAAGMRFGHEVNGKRRQIPSALIRAAVQHHSIEAQQIFGSRVETPARRRKDRALSMLCWITSQDGSGGAHQ